MNEISPKSYLFVKNKHGGGGGEVTGQCHQMSHGGGGGLKSAEKSVTYYLNGLFGRIPNYREWENSDSQLLLF